MGVETVRPLSHHIGDGRILGREFPSGGAAGDPSRFAFVQPAWPTTSVDELVSRWAPLERLLADRLGDRGGMLQVVQQATVDPATLDAALDQWRKDGGDQIRHEYEEAWARNNG